LNSAFTLFEKIAKISMLRSFGGGYNSLSLFSPTVWKKRISIINIEGGFLINFLISEHFRPVGEGKEFHIKWNRFLLPLRYNPD
jgi:hypothetical protein